MIPMIVLIGRTNVGKSTIFNILTKTKNALVSNHQGITRDRQYGSIVLKYNTKAILIDTAGFDIQSNEIEIEAYKQTLKAIQESNLILFIVDAHAGLMPQENDIAKKIRKYHKKTILVINKIDGANSIPHINEFYMLGFKNIQQISAIHNRGIDTLKNKYLIPWIEKTFQKQQFNNEIIKKLPIKIAFIGKPNVGKSTLINKILNKKRMITSYIAGTTRDSISTEIKYNNKNYLLIDTAGVSKNKRRTNIIEKFSIIKTFQTIEQSNVVLLIIDANVKICHRDLSLANFIINTGKGIIIIINKCDLLNAIEKKKIHKIIEQQIKFFHFLRIHFISALNNQGIFEIFNSIYESYQASQIKISTSKLTKIMHMATKKHQPPMIKGQQIKLKYAHLGSSNPLTIIIHGNRVKYLSSSYKKYLMNLFYNILRIKGAPIQIQFKENVNPYIKKNTN
ncbi:ribosome biogenesis GTPase Der [Buchnera aphidicola]|uniref:GTPase Der n=1 Tax=Buchnera aphidicola subsp. Uroleucon sonchi TaxID=118118 RepID=A0A6C1FCX1_BUCUN|nr:ribosome biogenesis GTPase Der [Buchnera aphidicola]QIE02267.1 ribosome biogenesis GTPase Der [Buchnera aphidicola (Uroleucon sonchi)]